MCPWVNVQQGNSLESAFAARPPVSTGLAANAGVPSGAIAKAFAPFSQPQGSQMLGQLQGQQGMTAEKSASNASSLPGLSQPVGQHTPSAPTAPTGPMSVPSATRQSSQVGPAAWLNLAHARETSDES